MGHHPMGSSLFPTAVRPPPSTAPVTDLELVERARRHEDEAWAELVHRHHVAVYRTAYAAVLRHDQADDAAQEAWMAAWQRLDGFREASSFRTWLLAIAWRKAIDRRRALSGWLRRLAWAPRDDDEQDEVAYLADDVNLDAETALLDREARQRVRRALGGVPRTQRDCLLLAAGGELTYDEIAGVLGIPTGTVKWRVSEARKHLRTRLAGLER